MCLPMKTTSTFQSVLLSTALLAACGDDDTGPTDSGAGVLLTDGGVDALASGEVTVNPGSLELAGETLSAHWSRTGGQEGEVVAVGVFPATGAPSFNPATLEAPADQRSDLSDLMSTGTWSFAWLVVETSGNVVAVAENHMLLALSEPVSADSLPGKLLNLSADLRAGMHLLQTREYTAAEIEAFDTCVADNPDDPDACVSFKEHVEVVAFDTSINLIAGDLDSTPDLS